MQFLPQFLSRIFNFRIGRSRLVKLGIDIWFKFKPALKFLFSQTFERIDLIFNMCYLGDNVSSWRYSLVILKRDLIFMGGRVEFVGGIRTDEKGKWEKMAKKETKRTRANISRSQRGCGEASTCLFAIFTSAL